MGAANFLPARSPATWSGPVGCFHPVCVNGCRAVDVLVRPELLELAPDPAGTGEVVGREFRGHDVFYRVRLADGTMLCAHRPSTEVVALGARVALHAHAGRVAVFASEVS
jgi:hypothetical protein